MFIGRKSDNSIYGVWTVRQWPGQEVLPEDDAEVLTFLVPKPVVTEPNVREVLKVLKRKNILSDADVDEIILESKDKNKP